MDSNIDTLKTYINTRRENGISDEVIYEALTASGWQHDLVVRALSAQVNGDESQSISPQPVIPSVVAARPDAVAPAEKSLYKGRLNRTGFLMAHVYILAYFIVALIAVMSGRGSSAMNIIGFLMGAIGVLMVMILPFFFYARRWHDINQSGWLSLLLLIPGAGLPIGIILLCVPGTNGQNKYGAIDQQSLSPAAVYGLSTSR
ncbi:MAG: DUF805 domain-containing protein [Candidatus Saccharimonadales bacterium]